MAVRTDIQYVQFYVDGSTARKPEQKTQAKHAAAPRTYKRKRKVVVIDPVAIVGAVVTVCLLVSMAVGLFQYLHLQNQTRQMAQYMQTLQMENTQLQQTYEDGYDLDQIRDMANELGLVPADQVQQITVSVQLPQEEPVTEMTLWESFTTFLAGLFA